MLDDLLDLMAAGSISLGEAESAELWDLLNDDQRRREGEGPSTPRAVGGERVRWLAARPLDDHRRPGGPLKACQVTPDSGVDGPWSERDSRREREEEEEEVRGGGRCRLRTAGC